MTVRDTLPAILRGDEGSDLGPKDRGRLEDLGQQALADGLVVHVRDECAARLRQADPSPAVEYLLAVACALNGEIERAHQTLLTLGERLGSAKRWEPLAAVAERALELEETHAAARLLVQAHEGLKKDPGRIRALERAWEISPEDLELGLLLVVRLGEAGEGERRRGLLTELLPRFAQERRYAGLEEAALEFVEHAEPDCLVRMIETLPAVAGQGALGECRQLLDIAFPTVSKAGQAGECLAALRAVVATAAASAGGPDASEPFRAATVEALRQGPGRELPDAAAVIAQAGLEDRTVPLPTALERFDLLAALAPGRAVLHGSFGAGRVAANDGQIVIIDFAKSRGHKMPYAAARRTLTPLAEDDLRLLQLTAPAELARLRQDEPGEILVRALHGLGGAADAQKLKVFLVGHALVPSADWTSFFRRARAAAVKDPRIDHARAFEQHYQLARTDAAGASREVEVPLPALAPRKPVKSNLATLRKFLSQHPQAEEALAQRFGRFVERALLDDEGELSDRARAGLYFARWYPLRQPEWTAVLKDLWERGLSISDLSGEEEQIALLEVSHAVGVESDAILSALDSRFSAVREAAIRFRDLLDDAGRAALRRTMVDHAPRYPAAALRLLEEELERPKGPPDAWNLLWSACALIEDRPKPSLAEKILGWLEPGGPFDRILRGVPCPEQQALRIGILLRQWRSSDRFLFPALEAASRLGLQEAVAAVRSARQKKTERMFEQVGRQADVEIPVMTRATWERLKKELERLERELKTTIPATIQKARELGDLKENAEYHSAKLKQANVSKQVASLQLRLTRARFVEEAELKDGVVGLGTEVVLESEQELTTYWILGEGEHHHGDHVISFQTPVARALMGHAIGDEVDVEVDGARLRYRVVSIERRLPPHESGAETAAPA